MNVEARITEHFHDSANVKTRLAESVAPSIAGAASALVAALKAGNKVLICGNGGSAADSQHFAAELVGRFERERRNLPAIALTTDTSAITAIANDYSFEQVFSRQVAALGRKGDVLIAISTSGNSPNVLKAMEVAHAEGLVVIALTGRNGGKMAAALTPSDHHLNVPNERTIRIQEVHILMLHILCDLTDNLIFGEKV
jgi:D-sedoheptulose 7-phosphate isomerase